MGLSLDRAEVRRIDPGSCQPCAIGERRRNRDRDHAARVERYAAINPSERPVPKGDPGAARTSRGARGCATVLAVVGIWTWAREVARDIDRGKLDGDHGEAWRRTIQRVAMLPEEIGAELDKLDVPLRRARVVAYGWSRIEQRRRLSTMKEQMKHPAEPMVVKRGPSKPIKLRGKGLRIPRAHTERFERALASFVGEFMQTLTKLSP